MAQPIVSQFAKTKQLFKESLVGYTFPISYAEWYTADADLKAALLFVNFYKEIALAWSKWNAPYFSSEDGVSLALQYVNKQVDRLIINPKLFTPQYFYKVAWNAFGGYIQTHVSDKRRSECEISNYIDDTDGLGNHLSVDITDLFPNQDDDYETAYAKEAVWNIIDSLGLKAEKVVNHLINPSDSLRRTSHRNSSYAHDRLRDVCVTVSEYDAIIVELQDKLLPYREFFEN